MFLLFLSVAVFFGVLEGLLRIGVIEYTNADLENPESMIMVSENEVLVYEWKPKYSHPESPEAVTNSEGMRTRREFPLHKDRNHVRIAAFGDSLTGPPDIYPNKTWPGQLERLLNNASRSLAYEVLNFGVNGYSLHQQVEALLTKGLPFQPDLVIFGYVMNDPEISNRLTDDIAYSSVKSVGFLIWKFKTLKQRLGGMRPR